jgi:hypothetical protein
MAAGGKREEMDARITQWEQELERVRLSLARAPENVHARWNPDFIALFRQKELVKSAWEAIRGVYQAEPAAAKRFEEALAAMEGAWSAARPMLAEVLTREAA